MFYLVWIRFFAKQPNCIGFSAGPQPTPFSPERGTKKEEGEKKQKERNEKWTKVKI